MNYKPQLITAVSLATFLTVMPMTLSPVFAVGASPKPGRQALIVNRTITASNQEIDRRISALKALINRISAMKMITADQKTSLTTQVNTEIENLTTLKTKIDTETDLATIRADRKSIVDAYRVFVVYMPKITIIANADKELDLAKKIDTASQKYSSTTNTTKWTDLQTQLATANKQAQAAIDAVVALDPAGYPGNKSTLQSARDMLKQARTALNAAYADLKAIRLSTKTK